MHCRILQTVDQRAFEGLAEDLKGVCLVQWSSAKDRMELQKSSTDAPAPSVGESKRLSNHMRGFQPARPGGSSNKQIKQIVLSLPEPLTDRDVPDDCIARTKSNKVAQK